MNGFDYLLAALVVISVLAGLMRGLLREIVSLVTWVTAVWMAWHYAPAVEPHLGGLLAYEGVRPWVARGIVFVLVVLAGSVIALLVNRLVRLSLFSATDRALGGLFGLLRGFIAVGIFIIVCHAVRLEGESWWHGSLLVPYGERAANVLRSMVGERKILPGKSVSASP